MNLGFAIHRIRLELAHAHPVSTRLFLKEATIGAQRRLLPRNAVKTVERGDTNVQRRPPLDLEQRPRRTVARIARLSGTLARRCKLAAGTHVIGRPLGAL